MRPSFTQAHDPFENEYDLQSPEFLESLAQLQPSLTPAGPPMAAVLVHQRGETARKLFLRHPEDPAALSQALDGATPTPGINLVPEAITSIVSKGWDEASGKLIFCVGSLVKQMIFLTFLVLMREGEFSESALDMEAVAMFNSVSAGENQTRLNELTRDPTLGHLSVHHSALAPANRFLFSPYGDLVASDEELIASITEITADWIRQEEDRGTKSDVTYSNVNYWILALIMVRKCNKDLPRLVKEHLFEPLGMDRTYLGSQQLNSHTANGFRMSADGTKFFQSPHHDLNSIVAQASVGCWTCTDDLAKLYEAVIKGYHDDTEPLGKKISARFLAAQIKGGSDEPGSSPAGNLSNYPAEPLARDSLNRTFNAEAEATSSAVKNVKRLFKSSKWIHNKGGTADGFTSSMYLCVSDEFFVIVLCNSTGPVDLSEPFARSILEERLFGNPLSDVSAEIQECFHTARSEWQRIEQETVDSRAWTGSLLPFIGLFRHSVTRRLLVIKENGVAIIRNEDNELFRTQVGVQGNRIRLFPRSSGLFVDRITSWRNVDFELKQEGTTVRLVGDDGVDIYVRQQEE